MIRVAAGFVAGIATATSLLALALISGEVDRRIDRRRKEWRAPTDIRHARHVRRAPARWTP